jgi:hypothetical protein
MQTRLTINANNKKHLEQTHGIEVDMFIWHEAMESSSGNHNHRSLTVARVRRRRQHQTEEMCHQTTSRDLDCADADPLVFLRAGEGGNRPS